MSENSSYTYLTGTILLANLDYTGWLDYAIKALIGGTIWLIFKLAGDYYARKINPEKQEPGPPPKKGGTKGEHKARDEPPLDEPPLDTP